MYQPEVNSPAFPDLIGIVDLDALAMWRQRLKEEERIAKERIDEVDSLIINAIVANTGSLPEEGTASQKTDKFKISVTTKLTRALDYEAYRAVEEGIPESVRCIDLEPKINPKKLRAIDLVKPGFSAQFITTKASKPTVKVEALA